jgi:hypothetical protein
VSVRNVAHYLKIGILRAVLVQKDAQMQGLSEQVFLAFPDNPTFLNNFNAKTTGENAYFFPE